MEHSTVTRSSVLRLVAGVATVTTLAACSGAAPATTDQRAVASAAATPPGATPAAAVPDTTPAPGSERLTPDQHPEQAHLTQVTVDSLAEAISSYVQGERERHSGVFPVPDPDRGAPLGLTLTTVHRERLSQLADGRYFACADFNGREGDTYDIDIFMRAESSGLVPTDLIVHKVNGTARFNWSERNGVWSRTPIADR